MRPKRVQIPDPKSSIIVEFDFLISNVSKLEINNQTLMLQFELFNQIKHISMRWRNQWNILQLIYIFGIQTCLNNNEKF